MKSVFFVSALLLSVGALLQAFLDLAFPIPAEVVSTYRVDVAGSWTQLIAIVIFFSTLAGLITFVWGTVSALRKPADR